jgi:hypothetical protein
MSALIELARGRSILGSAAVVAIGMSEARRRQVL